MEMTFEIFCTILLGLVCLAIAVYIIVAGIKNKWLSKILSTIHDAIGEAEQKFGSGHGDEKKDFVIQRVKEKCSELGIPYDILYNLVCKLIDRVVANYNVIAKHKSEDVKDDSK